MDDNKLIDKIGRGFTLVLLFSILTFGFIYTQRFYSHIDKSDAEIIHAHFSQYVQNPGPTGSNHICFTDYRNLSIPCDSKSLHTIHPGAELVVLKNPHANIALEIREDGKTILEYDKAIRAVERHRHGAAIFFISLYVLIYGGLIYCFIQEHRHK